MFDVDLECGKCGKHISQLPFQPSGDRPVFCSECNREYRETRTSNRGERQMFDVDETCAGCGTAITQLPFQPTGDKPLYCRECLVANRNK